MFRHLTPTSHVTRFNQFYFRFSFSFFSERLEPPQTQTLEADLEQIASPTEMGLKPAVEQVVSLAKPSPSRALQANL